MGDQLGNSMGTMRTAALKKNPVGIPGSVEMEVPESGYQPSGAEQGREMDMPGLDVNELRGWFVRPIRFVEKMK